MFNKFCTWIKEVWEDISPDMIIKSFKTCCISNALDGSEDHLIYDDCESDEEMILLILLLFMMPKNYFKPSLILIQHNNSSTVFSTFVHLSWVCMGLVHTDSCT